tara:strand:+ start:502 stop:903 length:402 start_codon:yes stop_codon:yes gene_type:complete
MQPLEPIPEIHSQRPAFRQYSESMTTALVEAKIATVTAVVEAKLATTSEQIERSTSKMLYDLNKDILTQIHNIVNEKFISLSQSIDKNTQDIMRLANESHSLEKMLQKNTENIKVLDKNIKMIDLTVRNIVNS